MTETITTCLSCSKPFTAKRSTKRFCSQRCKQAAYRNAGHHDASPVQDWPGRQDAGRLVRVWGPGELSEIECRLLGIRPTGEKAGNAWLYRTSVAAAATEGKLPGPGVLPNASAPGGDPISRREG